MEDRWPEEQTFEMNAGNGMVKQKHYHIPPGFFS